MDHYQPFCLENESCFKFKCLYFEIKEFETDADELKSSDEEIEYNIVDHTFN